MMKPSQLGRIAGALLVASGMTGCVVKVGSDLDDESRREVRHEVHKSAPPIVLVPANTEDSATMAEIDAATKLSFDAGKVPVLKNIAARPSLGPATQVHLVNTSLRTLSFDAGKIEVLLVLVGNPAFNAAGKEAILRQIERLDFDASRTRVMGAIQERAESKGH